jgi:Family of unknown function (DUF6496)
MKHQGKKKPVISKEKIKVVMKEFEKGGLKSSNGKKVTDKDQALAIGYSEARKKK